MAPEIVRQPPPYRQVADWLRQSITDGTLKAGQQAPTVRQLMADFEVAYATAHRAIKQLQTEGYLISRPGRGGGNYVTSEDERAVSAAEHAEKASRTGLIYPDGQYAVITAAELVTAPAAVASALGVDTGSDVIRRQRVRYTTDDKPSSYSISWLPGSMAERAPKLLETERIKSGTFSYIASVTGRQVSGGQEQVWAEAADETVAQQLKIAPGTPVAAGRNWIVDSAGATIEYGESWSLGRLTARWGTLTDE